MLFTGLGVSDLTLLLDELLLLKRINRKKEEEVYVHKSCKPIIEVDLNKEDNQLDLFDGLCEGYCGN